MRTHAALAVFLAAQILSPAATAQVTHFRPPAVPLVTSDPYLSIWSESDRLTGDVTRHWTHRPHPLVSLVRIDGQTYRLLGSEPREIPAFPQKGLHVTATRTIAEFTDGKVKINLGFMTPALPNDLNVYARPVTYIAWAAASVDGAAHRIQILGAAGSSITVESPDQRAVVTSSGFDGLVGAKMGSEIQSYLRPAGDDTRIDWGYAYVEAPATEAPALSITGLHEIADSFAKDGPPVQTADKSRPADSNQLYGALQFDLGEVGSNPVSRHLMIGYDEIYSIDYYGKKLRPYWRRHGEGPGELFQAAERDHADLVTRCTEFDRELSADAESVGGPEYAQIVALSYRECVAANGLAADANGQPLFFTKENTSNGDIATVDVIFPMDPIWVLLSPTLAKASLASNFMYSASTHWKFPNAPHDLGTYPQVFGRDDGGEGMPVEESGNMILLTDAIAHDDGNAAFASKWWPQLTQWAKYLEQYGLDPEDQLCTDDFMGHLAHNANLSVKAILALAAYGDLCHYRGDESDAKRYADLARTDAQHWMRVADAGGHSLLAFDKPGTWSQKYNLVWDRVLGLNVFPPSVAANEIAYYKSVMQPFGVPLDSRTHLTKTDWSIWSASMAISESDFEFLVDPIYNYLNQTAARDPIADSYETDNVKSGGMHARPVVGGFFVRFLEFPEIWKKWSSRDHTRLGAWAPLPKPPVVTEIVPTAQTNSVVWRYTTTRPSGDWTATNYDDSSWARGRAGFGTEGTPNAIVGTRWDTDDIWIRRDFVMPNYGSKDLAMLVYHDEDIEVYANGVLATTEGGYVNRYQPLDISASALKLLKPGAHITLAAHCHQTTGGQGVDVGICAIQER